MTCIVGLVDKQTVWMGGDSASVSEDGAIGTVKQRKVFHNGSCIFGCAGSWRQISAIALDLEPPDFDGAWCHDDADFYVARELIPAVKQSFRDAGLDDSTCDQFLVGVAGRLFLIDTDWHVEEPISGIAAIGNGGQVGLGAVVASKLTPQSRILRALRIASDYAAGVRSPFYVEKV